MAPLVLTTMLRDLMALVEANGEPRRRLLAQLVVAPSGSGARRSWLLFDARWREGGAEVGEAAVAATGSTKASHPNAASKHASGGASLPATGYA